jgi:UDP-N-acetylmuramoylalanine--D-glutamate ligase
MRKGPDVAVVTNVAPNHLDVHKDMDEYIDAKKNILLHQNAFSRTVLNLDNEITKDFEDTARGQKMFFSMKNSVKSGAWLNKDGYLTLSYRGISVPLLHKDDITILGDHNVENYLAAISAVWGYVGADSIVKVAHDFTGVEHRIEFVREVDGVKYYNDSIASSPTRTIAGLKAFNSKVILLAGGYDKLIPFEPMVPYVIDKVKLLILNGPTAEKIENAVKNSEKYTAGTPQIIKVNNYDEAVKVAHEMAVPGDIVTLSPACASFDAYANFVERGNHFKELVNKL